MCIYQKVFRCFKRFGYAHNAKLIESDIKMITLNSLVATMRSSRVYMGLIISVADELF